MANDEQNKQKKGPMSNFEEALGYVGPRLVSLLIGGHEAMEDTDKVLKGAEEQRRYRHKEQLAAQDREFQKRIADKKLKLAEDKAARGPEDKKMTSYQKQTLDLKKAEEKRKRDAERRRGEQFIHYKGVQSRASDKEVKEFAQFDEGERILGEIEEIYSRGDVHEDLGPYGSRMEQAKANIPGMERSDDFVVMQQLVGITLANYVKSISGAQVSEQEAQRLKKNIPEMGDKPRAFKTKFDTFKRMLNAAKTDYIKKVGAQKKGALQYLDKKEEPDLKRKANMDKYNLK
ncbi:MAG: hypothetical protein Unbinned8261contig1001_2 [Prokaryotic dsDNA virus sp.]|nr:MAG: hypothetical protein Unbinned8261contig1001_2 [Prokaryotic dsDNA virus sp.]|tara:strand:+ start:12665 stop:13528 length:864 start_codon:yes stop_codon:yes gene_type:complete